MIKKTKEYIIIVQQNKNVRNVKMKINNKKCG